MGAFYINENVLYAMVLSDAYLIPDLGYQYMKNIHNKAAYIYSMSSNDVKMDRNTL